MVGLMVLRPDDVIEEVLNGRDDLAHAAAEAASRSGTNIP